MHLYILFLSITNLAFLEANDRNIVVETNKGYVNGERVLVEKLNKTVNVFLGIPYAKPPVGNLRFKRPQPVEPWEKPLDATVLPYSCFQSIDEFFGPFYGSELWNPNTLMSENCLYLNIWVPENNSQIEEFAVLIWIHGGAFSSGSAILDVYDGKYLAATNNVIIVTIAYRLGVLGFLTLDESSSISNAGLFDQMMAMEWVSKNIRYFGGDPNRITLFGESAGAGCVGLHLVSPLSRRYFQQAILQSGSSTANWAISSRNEGKRRSIKLALALKCPTRSPNLILSCLKSIPVERLIVNQVVTPVLTSFTPVVDGTFILDDPIESLKKKEFKKCPILLGSNLNEGSYFLIYQYPKILGLDYFYMNNSQFEEIMDEQFHYHPKYPDNIKPHTLEAIKFYYNNRLNPDNDSENINLLDKAIGDRDFTCEVNKLAKFYAAADESVYMYYFTHRYVRHNWPAWMGVLHGDDIFMNFGDPFKQPKKYSSSEKLLSEQIMKYWSNFAKTGDPNKEPGQTPLGHWPLHTASGKEYLELNAKYLDVVNKSEAHGRGPRLQQCVFWNEYLPKLNKLPLGNKSNSRFSLYEYRHIQIYILMSFVPVLIGYFYSF